MSLLSFLFNALVLRRRSRGDALTAAAPVDDLSLVDLLAAGIARNRARLLADCAIDVDHPVARPRSKHGSVQRDRRARRVIDSVQCVAG
jgi:hypothetical protein